VSCGAGGGFSAAGLRRLTLVVAGLPRVVGREDALVADDEQAVNSAIGVSPMRRHQPWLMLLLAGSLAVEKVRSAADRRA
jgi:hypothetical protein